MNLFFQTDFLSLLDDITWHDIFLHLDGISLTRASETCKRFNVIISESSKLLDKWKVSLEFPDVQTGESSQFNCGTTILPTPIRSYQHLEIIRLHDDFLHRTPEFTASFFNVMSKLSSSVKTLVIRNCQLLRKDLVKILRKFSQLIECSFQNVLLYDDLAPTEISNIPCPNLTKLVLSKCDLFCLLVFKSHEKFKSVSILEPHYIRADIEEIENFLLRQSNLKELNLLDFRFNSSYSTNRLANVPFQLDSLSLNDVNWDILQHCGIFLRTQRCLKKLELKNFNKMIAADNYQWFCDVMRHFFTNNPQLRSFAIDTRLTSHEIIKDEDFLVDIVNQEITNLCYSKGGGDKSQLLKIFTRMFPNVKLLKFNDASSDSTTALPLIQLFKSLESLEMKLAPASLSEFKFESNKLKFFKYCATNEEKSAEKIRDIFARNRCINQIALNIEPLTVEEIIEILMPLAVSLESLSIADLHLTPEEADMITLNFPSLRKIRSDFRLNPEAVNVLNRARISFEFIVEESPIVS